MNVHHYGPLRIWTVTRGTTRSWHTAIRCWRIGTHITIHQHGSRHLSDRWVFQTMFIYDRK